jgi:hypothetical protein
MPDQAKLECPDGQEAKALWRASVSAVRQISQVTRIGIDVVNSSGPSPPTLCFLMLSGDKSGSHRASKCGLGFPATSFNPSVIIKALARDNPRPIHAVFHSHNFLRRIKERGVVGDEGSGIRRDIKAVIIPGARIETAASTLTLTVSAW